MTKNYDPEDYAESTFEDENVSVLLAERAGRTYVEVENKTNYAESEIADRIRFLTSLDLFIYEGELDENLLERMFAEWRANGSVAGEADAFISTRYGFWLEVFNNPRPLFVRLPEKTRKLWDSVYTNYTRNAEHYTLSGEQIVEQFSALLYANRVGGTSYLPTMKISLRTPANGWQTTADAYLEVSGDEVRFAPAAAYEWFA